METKYSIQVPETVRRFTKIYHAVGLWRTGNGNISLLQVVYIIWFSLFGLSAFVGVGTIDDTSNAVFLAVVVFVATVQIYRLYVTQWKQNQILDFMHTISVDSTDHYQAFCNANNKIEYLMRLAKWYLIISYNLSAAVICVPLIKKKLLFDIAFPWDYTTNEIAFWMAYALVAGTYTLSITLVMFISMIWYMMLIFVVKYDFLASDFKNLGVERKFQGKELLGGTSHTNNVQRKKNSYLQDLVAAIKRLEMIKGQLDEFESMFASLFLLQIITSSMCICGTTFVLAFMTHDSVFQYVFYTVEILFCLNDIFAVLYLANEIMLSSDRLSYSLFESNWIVQTESCKKYMIIVMEYLKQPRRFIVGKLFALDLEMFTMIVRRSFSMFNILRNFKH